MSFNLQSAIFGLRLQSAVCSLQSAVYSLQSAVYGLQSTVCSLQSAVCSLQMSYTGNEYNKAWLNTNWLKQRIYFPYSSRNCFESFEYSEERIASIHKKFLPSLAFIGFLHKIGFLHL